MSSSERPVLKVGRSFEVREDGFGDVLCVAVVLEEPVWLEDLEQLRELEQRGTVFGRDDEGMWCKELSYDWLVDEYPHWAIVCREDPATSRTVA